MHGTLSSTQAPIERLYDTGWAWVYGWAMCLFDCFVDIEYRILIDILLIVWITLLLSVSS